MGGFHASFLMVLVGTCRLDPDSDYLWVVLEHSAWDELSDFTDLTDRSPIEAWVEIKKPADAVRPALVREYEGWTQRRSIWTFGFPELHHKSSSSRETIVLIRLGATSEVTHTVIPKPRWEDGRFGYTLLPALQAPLQSVKSKVEGQERSICSPPSLGARIRRRRGRGIAHATLGALLSAVGEELRAAHDRVEAEKSILS